MAFGSSTALLDLEFNPSSPVGTALEFDAPSHATISVVPLPGYIDPATGLPAQASASSFDTEAFGLISVIDPDTLGYYRPRDLLDVAGHGFTVGDVLYLQDGGGVGTTPGTNVQKIYEVVTDAILMYVGWPMFGAASTGWSDSGAWNDGGSWDDSGSTN